jgi:hypothetical protein
MKSMKKSICHRQIDSLKKMLINSYRANYPVSDSDGLDTFYETFNFNVR